MESDRTDGSGHPGIPRPLRGRGRSANIGTEINAGFTESRASMARICIWPRDPICRRSLWRIMAQHGLPIIHVARVRQTVTLRRYDIFVAREKGMKVLKKLKRLARNFNWYVKRHSSFSNRKRKRLRASMANVAEADDYEMDTGEEATAENLMAPDTAIKKCKVNRS